MQSADSDARVVTSWRWTSAPRNGGGSAFSMPSLWALHGGGRPIG
jgi:hypothetical protein